MSSSKILAPRSLLPPFRPTLGTHSPAHHIAESRHVTDMAAVFTVCLCTANSGPPHKTEHRNLRRTIEAIIWRHENGAKWRSIPPHLGPWWMAAQTFICWSHHGVWERLLEQAQQREGLRLGMAFLDGSTIRALQKAAGGAKKGDLQQSGTSVRRWAAPAAASPPRPLS